ncbi:MAG: cupin domain-containing protein [Bacteroidia bacterium]|nr:cupin domain-containing protein [Bacteroidia bacterium]
MIINYDSIEEQALPHFKGGEKEFHARMFFDGLNRIMKGRLEPGASIGLHIHDTSSEIMFITKGEGHVIYDGEKIALKAGDVHYCPKGHEHTLINDGDGDLEFSAVVPQQ